MAGVRITLTGDVAARERLAAAPEVISRALDRAMGRSLDIVYRRAVFNLTAGNPLHVKTGRLRQSIATAQRISDHAGIIGTNVEYAAAQEFGFVGAEQVRAHSRNMTQAFGVRLKVPKRVQVGPYARLMRIPERPYLRPALADSQAEIAELFRAGVAAAIGAR